MKNIFELKNDEYRRARGGTAVFLQLQCARCGNDIMIYQKDGPGSLLRCYLNRIFSPPELEKLQRSDSIRQPGDMSSLVCSKCGGILGYPMQYRDGRLAFSLVVGAVSKRKLKR